MSALGGSIEALLKLDISDFEAKSKQAITQAQDLQKEMNFNNTGIQKATGAVSALNSGMVETEGSTSKLNSELASGRGVSGIQKTAGSVQTLSSRIVEAESFATALGTKFSSGLGVSGIQRASGSVQTFSSRLVEAEGFATALGSNMERSSSVMSGGWTKVTGAVNTAGGAIKSLGSRLSEAASSMSTFSASLAAMVGTMGAADLYQATVTKANAYSGLQGYWGKVYGSGTQSTYEAAVENMANNYYTPRSSSTKTLQLLTNTISGESSSQIAGLLPYVTAYTNFYKAMKPDLSPSFIDVDAPQDIAAVFSGNTGEIRSSPIASQLKNIASMDQDQKLPALEKLFNSEGIMEYAKGITTYDQNLNKFNTTLDKLNLTVGNELLPTVTTLLGDLNSGLSGLGSNGKYLIYLTGLVAALAALGGVGTLALQGLNIVSGGIKGVAKAGSWFGTKIGLLTDVLDKDGNKVGTTVSSKVKNALSKVGDTAGNALSNVPSKVKSALSGAGDSAGNALSTVKDKVYEKLSPVADAAGTAMSGVKSAVTSKLIELKNWVNTNYSLTPSGSNGNGGNKTAILPLAARTLGGTLGGLLGGDILAQYVIGPTFQGMNKDTFQAYNGILDYFGLENTDIPSTIPSLNDGKTVLKAHSYNAQIAEYNKNRRLGPHQDPGSWVSWLGKTGYQATFGANPAGWLSWIGKGVGSTTQGNVDYVKGALGNTGSFFNWLGKTGYQSDFGVNPKGWLSWINKGVGSTTQGNIDYVKGALKNTGSWMGWLGGNVTSLNSGVSQWAKGGWQSAVGTFTGAEKGLGGWLGKLLPQPAAGADGSGKHSITSDIFGKNGLLDFSRFGIKIPQFKWPTINLGSIGQYLQKAIPKLKWPNINLSGIGQWIQKSVPKLKWPSLSGMGKWVQDRIPHLNWKIPSIQDVKNFIWNRINPLNWKIPTLDEIKGDIWNRIDQLHWSIPSFSDILGIIQKAIPPFSWPSGPGGVITGAVHRAESNFSKNMSEIQSQRQQSASNTVSYSQTSSFKDRMNQRWGGLIGRGPAGPRENRVNLKNFFSGFSYEDYEGSRKTIPQTLQEGRGNCFDLTLAQMFMASQTGLDSEMVWSTWDGGSHVYPIVDGEVQDAAHHALNNSWNAPPKGPAGDSGSSTDTTTDATANSGSAVAAVNQFQAQAVPKAGGKLGSALNTAIEKPVTVAMNYSTKYVKGGVNEMYSDFQNLVPQASGAWNAVANAVIGPIQTIVSWINRLTAAIGGSGFVAAGGDVAAGTKPTTITNGFETVPSSLLKTESSVNELANMGVDTDTVLKAAYTGDSGAIGNFAGGDLCSDGSCSSSVEDYGIFTGALNWISKIKSYVGTEINNLFGGSLTGSGSNGTLPIIGGYFKPSGYYGKPAGDYYWLNYCPFDHAWGVLENNPKHQKEGEITCSLCDADFDGTSGADKAGGGARAWLTPVSLSEVKSVQNWTATSSPSWSTGKLGTSLFKSAMSKLFGAFKYQFYWDDKKSNAQTLLQKSGNCMDMTQLLMSFANAMGLSATMVKGKWDHSGLGHVWANIAGIGDMDPTAWVQRHTWTPPAGSYAGGDTPISLGGGDITVIFQRGSFIFNGPVGMDDINKQIETGAETVINRLARQK